VARIAIIVGHSRRGTFCDALAGAYRRGALAAGHEVELIATAAMTFDPILHHGYEQIQPLEPDLRAAYTALLRADHLVIVFPLWLGTLPAILKGFLERVLQPDLVESSRQGKFLKVLKGKSARVIVTMGMPGFIYRWWYGAHALKMLKRNILSFMGVGPIRSTIYGNVEGMGPRGRNRRLDEIEAIGRRAS
jgi:putative NADPH-quinone reductase